MLEKIRCGQMLFERDTENENIPDPREWGKSDYPSISAAKKANGLNSRTIESPKLLPK